MKHWTKLWNREKGQSLVELALVFPIFLVIIAGVVEVSNLLIVKNRVETASRAAARFAAAGGSEPEVVALNAVTQTLDLSSGVWDIWFVDAKVNRDGDGFDEWAINKVYGLSNTLAFTEVNATIANCTQDCLADQILDELQTNEQGVHLDPDVNPNVDRIAANLEVVGVYVIHDVNSILGLEVIPGLAGWNSVKAFSTMRVTNPFEVNASNGCAAFPIAVHEGIRSLTPPGGGNPYPTTFSYPNPAPTYQSFYRNVEQIPLLEAREGYIYKIQDGGGAGNFGWLRWNNGISANANTLADSILWPGNSMDYANHNDGGQQATPLYSHVVRGYVNPIDNLDTAMQIGDWVSVKTGSTNSNAVNTNLQAHIRLGRQLRLVVWGGDPVGSGQNMRYQIKGFVIGRLHGYYLPQGQGDSWVLMEFIRWDNSCGQTS